MYLLLIRITFKKWLRETNINHDIMLEDIIFYFIINTVINYYSTFGFKYNILSSSILCPLLVQKFSTIQHKLHSAFDIWPSVRLMYEWATNRGEILRKCLKQYYIIWSNRVMSINVCPFILIIIKIFNYYY